jgi:hypothetical protein
MRQDGDKSPDYKPVEFVVAQFIALCRSYDWISGETVVQTGALCYHAQWLRGRGPWTVDRGPSSVET